MMDLQAPQETFRTGDPLEKKALKGERLFRYLVEDCTLEGLRLREARFLEGVFRGVTLLHGDATSAYLPRTRFERCVFQGIRFAGAYFRGGIFQGCKFRDCDFQGACLAETRFVDCEIQKCDFSLAEFSEARLEGVKIKNSKFFLADFSNAAADALAPFRDELKGALLPAGTPDVKA